jgi:hypothetical protein
MPYIKEEVIWALDNGEKEPLNAGELNYELTTVLLTYLKNKGESYQTYNDMVGALESCKLELYRRKISDYENKKIEENGDVY